MSNADPWGNPAPRPGWPAQTWGPPPAQLPPTPGAPPAPRRLPRWPFIAGGLAVIVVLAILTGILIRPLLGITVEGPDGGDGVGDPYYPSAGGGGYDAQRYRIDLSYDEATRELSGTTTMTAVATTELASLHLDLDLSVSKAEINGVGIEFTQSGRDVHVHSNQLLDPGERFTIRLTYAGRPADKGPEDVLTRDRELVIASEPFAAPYWFPSNDHPSDPAEMEMTLRVPADLQALSGGSLVSKDIAHEAGYDTWHWRSTEPMATYLNFLAIGPFDLTTGDANGRPYLYAISRQLTPEQQTRSAAALMTTPDFVRKLEDIWGPYPFTEVGGIVPSAEFEFGALENQPRPVYQVSSLVADPQRLVVHEYAHMWFGNNVTLRHWDDIIMNESYASYSEWMVIERDGGRSANESMLRMFRAVPDRTWRVPIDDPGPDDLFDNVYTRGPMALQALRNLMGDEAFFRLSREWANEKGTRSLEDWQDRARRHSPVDLEHYFQVWFSATEKPAETPENGFR